MSRSRMLGLFLVLSCLKFAAFAALAQEATTGSAPSTQPAAADPEMGVVLVQESAVTGSAVKIPPQRMITKVLGRESRTDIGDQVTTFVRSNGESVTLMHAQRMYTVVKPSLVKEGLERLESIQDEHANAVKAESESPKPAFKPTGERKRIGDHEAIAYDFTPMAGIGNGIPTRYWFAENYPDAEAIRQKLSVFSASYQFLGVRPAGLPKGVVLRTETQTPRGEVFIVDTLSAKVERMDKAIFDIPAGYSKMAMTQPPR